MTVNTNANSSGIDIQKRRPWFALATAIICICIVTSVAAMPFIAVVIDGYDYQGAWVSSYFAVMARSFQEHGVLALGGVPIQNNPPLTALPDAYLNWPPLYPIFLSIVFSVFGESEVVHHLVAVSINLGIAALVFAFVRRQAGSLAGAMAVLAFLSAPLVARYGHVGLHLHLAILLCLAGLYCFVLASEDPNSQHGMRSWPAIAGAGLM